MFGQKPHQLFDRLQRTAEQDRCGDNRTHGDLAVDREPCADAQREGLHEHSHEFDERIIPAARELEIGGGIHADAPLLDMARDQRTPHAERPHDLRLAQHGLVRFICGGVRLMRLFDLALLRRSLVIASMTRTKPAPSTSRPRTG